MSDIRRNADRNRAIQAMMTDGEQLKTFYRFVANNPHIALHDACQIVIERPNASVCFSFEEWNAQGRRVTKGRKGIPYYDSDGNKYFVFDIADTHGENRYRRITQPVKKILDGLDLLNGTEIAESNRGDYRIMLSGVVTYLGQNDFLSRCVATAGGNGSANAKSGAIRKPECSPARCPDHADVGVQVDNPIQI